MPPVELNGNSSEMPAGQPASITPVPAAFVPPSVRTKIGIIYPPPEVRSECCFLSVFGYDHHLFH